MGTLLNVGAKRALLLATRRHRVFAADNKVFTESIACAAGEIEAASELREKIIAVDVSAFAAIFGKVQRSFFMRGASVRK